MSIIGEQMALPINNTPQVPIEGNMGPVAEEVAHLTDVRHPPQHVFEALFVGFIVGNENDARVRVRHFLNAGRKIDNGDLLRAAHVENFASGAGMSGYANQHVHRIVDVSEATALLAIAEDGYVMPGKCLANKVGNHHSVTPSLPRAHGIE